MLLQKKPYPHSVKPSWAQCEHLHFLRTQKLIFDLPGDGQPPPFEHFKKDVENLVNIKVVQPRACKIFEFFEFPLSFWNFSKTWTFRIGLCNWWDLWRERIKFEFAASATHPCRVANGNCDHLCIPKQFSQHSCMCASGKIIFIIN